MGHADNRVTAHPTAAVREPSALEGVKVREVAAVFRAREELTRPSMRCGLPVSISPISI